MLLTLLFLLITGGAFAQTNYNDSLGIWTKRTVNPSGDRSMRFVLTDRMGFGGIIEGGHTKYIMRLQNGAAAVITDAYSSRPSLENSHYADSVVWYCNPRNPLGMAFDTMTVVIRPNGATSVEIQLEVYSEDPPRLFCDTTLTFEFRALTSSVSPTLQGLETQIPSHGTSHPTGAYQEPGGEPMEFIADELIIETNNPNSAGAFASSLGGTVIGSNAVPAPLPNSGINAGPIAPTRYTVTVHIPDISDNFLADYGVDAGFDGPIEVSSASAARLLGAYARASSEGMNVRLNYLGHGQSLPITSAVEATGITNNSTNPFTWPELISPTKWGDPESGCRSNVTRAWQFIQATQSLGGAKPGVRVAIIDGGFYLDQAGRSLTPDIAGTPIQYDFNSDDYIADGDNPAKCSSGTSCPYHGSGSASAAIGLVNNGQAAAGSGGQVGVAMLFKTNLSDDEVDRAIRTATAWGAGVINMSHTSYRKNTAAYGPAESIGDAKDHGVICVASAGNDARDNGLQGNDAHPADMPNVVNVGAINNSNNLSANYSNFGRYIRIWAPGTLTTGPDAGSLGANISFSGTSAAAPLVSGVVAMMKSVNPSLNVDQVNAILQRSAWKDSPDQKVAAAGYLNAYRAVLEAAGNRLPNDRFEQPGEGITHLALNAGSGGWDDVAISSTDDVDAYDFQSGLTGLMATATVMVSYVPSLGEIFIDTTMLRASGESTINGITTKSYIIRDIRSNQSIRFYVRGSAPNLYSLRINAIERVVLRDTFEFNDNLFYVADLDTRFKNVPYNATFHIKEDPDYYRFSSGDLVNPFLVFRFHITDDNLSNSAPPLAWQVDDNTGVETPFDPYTGLKLGKNQTVTVKIASNNQTGSYSFSLGYEEDIDRWNVRREVLILPWQKLDWGIRKDIRLIR